MILKNLSLKIIDLSDLLTAKLILITPEDCKWKPGQWNGGWATLTKQTASPSLILPGGSAVPGWTEPLLYTRMSTTKSKESFPEKEGHLDLLLSYFTVWSPWILTHEDRAKSRFSWTSRFFLLHLSV